MEVGRTEEGGVCGGSSQSNVQTRLDVTRLEEYWTKLLDTIDKTITEKCGNTRGVTYERNEACGGQNRFRSPSREIMKPSGYTGRQDRGGENYIKKRTRSNK